MNGVSQTIDTLHNYNQKLNWTDFQYDAESTDPIVVATDLRMEIEKVNVWTGVTTFKTDGIWIKGDSYVNSQDENQENLAFAKTIIDLTNYWAQQLESDINRKKINGGFENKMNKIFKKYYNNMVAERDSLKFESNFGLKEEVINSWNLSIKKRLSEIPKKKKKKK